MKLYFNNKKRRLKLKGSILIYYIRYVKIKFIPVFILFLIKYKNIQIENKIEHIF